MQSECPSCRRVLVYQGERPSYCAYCGASLGDSSVDRGRTTLGGDSDLDGTGLFVPTTETIDYGSSRRTPVGTAIEEFPARVASYRLIRKLGSGGMGTVFEAEDEAQGQRVAIKLISGTVLSSEEAVQRFRQEGRLASAVTHPRCVFVLGVDEYLGSPYIVMELMPGSTLQSLVDQHGPLAIHDAISRIQDVIEGLQEFHNQGMIHRDVKPSNCFIDQEGRVKIGDFGLSKSLEGGMDLTRTGSFLGTPLYASPEQIKRDAVDERTDLYSVTATLYFLLTARPPVRAKDATEALARIVSEPAPPPREFRSDLPKALEAVILRGLDRDPARRYRTLRELNQALLPFLPDRPTIGGIGRRILAYSLDLALFQLGKWTIFGAGILYHQGNIFRAYQAFQPHESALSWVERLLWIAYFTICEGLSGASLGKWVLGLRVSLPDRGGPPGLGRALVRILVFYALVTVGPELIEGMRPPPDGPPEFLQQYFQQLLFQGIGLTILASSMRQGRGYRGLHEWSSGTRVVQMLRLPHLGLQESRRLPVESRLEQLASTPAPDSIQQVGPYFVRAAVRWDPEDKVLLGHDSTLERPVWIVMRPSPAAAPPSARRTLNRLTRPRWIAGGELSENRWDAFTAPSGCPLVELARESRLHWRETLPLLRELTEEFRAARADGTFPRKLSIEQVWILSDGRAQYIDAPEELEPEEPAATDDAGDTVDQSGNSALTSGNDPADPEDRRALWFLGEVSRLALEGRTSSRWQRIHHALRQSTFPRGSEWGEKTPPKPPFRRVRAAVPERATLILDRLVGIRPSYAGLEALATDLENAAGRPTEVSASRRAIHLAIQTFFLLPGLAIMVLFSSPFLPPRSVPWDREIMTAVPLFWVLWAILSRGGMSFPLAGIVPVGNDGRRAGRLPCGLRALLVWTPPTLLFIASRILQEAHPETSPLAWGLWIGGIVLVILEAIVAVLLPGRGPHDRLAGTVLVPT